MLQLISSKVKKVVGKKESGKEYQIITVDIEIINGMVGTYGCDAIIREIAKKVSDEIYEDVLKEIMSKKGTTAVLNEVIRSVAVRFLKDKNC